MADEADVTKFTLTGRENAVVADGDDDDDEPDSYLVWVPVTLTYRPEVVYLTGTTPPRTLRLRPVHARIETGVLRLIGAELGVNDVRMVAKTSVLGLGDTPLLIDVAYGEGTVNGEDIDFRDQNFTFAAPSTDTTINLATVPRV